MQQHHPDMHPTGERAAAGFVYTGDQVRALLEQFSLDLEVGGKYRLH